MMMPRTRAIAATLLVICACALWSSWNARAIARRELHAASAFQRQVQHDLRELAQLRSRAASVDCQERPAEAIVTPLRAILESMGARAETLSGVSVPDAQPIPGGILARQSASLTLSGISSADLARVLTAWGGSQPLWTVRSIRMDRNESSKSTRESSDRFTAVVTLDNIHVRSGRNLPPTAYPEDTPPP